MAIHDAVNVEPQTVATCDVPAVHIRSCLQKVLDQGQITGLDGKH